MTTMARSESLFLSTLPGKYYYDPAIYEQEQEKIFSRMWVCIGRAEIIPPKPGAYQVVTCWARKCDRSSKSGWSATCFSQCLQA